VYEWIHACAHSNTINTKTYITLYTIFTWYCTTIATIITSFLTSYITLEHISIICIKLVTCIAYTRTSQRLSETSTNWSFEPTKLVMMSLQIIFLNEITVSHSIIDSLTKYWFWGYIQSRGCHRTYCYHCSHIEAECCTKARQQSNVVNVAYVTQFIL